MPQQQRKGRPQHALSHLKAQVGEEEEEDGGEVGEDVGGEEEGVGEGG